MTDNINNSRVNQKIKKVVEKREIYEVKRQTKKHTADRHRDNDNSSSKANAEIETQRVKQI